MITDKEIDAVAHALFDQDTYVPGERPTIPLFATKHEDLIQRYRLRARELLETAERARSDR
jgi:hypothetical protein